MPPTTRIGRPTSAQRRGQEWRASRGGPRSQARRRCPSVRLASWIEGGTRRPRARSGSTSGRPVLLEDPGPACATRAGPLTPGASRCRSRSRDWQRPALPVTHLAARRPVERRARRQELVEEEAESVDDAALGRGEPRELFGRRVAGIRPGASAAASASSRPRRRRISRVRSAELHRSPSFWTMTMSCGATRRSSTTEIQDHLQSLADPYRELERPSGARVAAPASATRRPWGLREAR